MKELYHDPFAPSATLDGHVYCLLNAYAVPSMKSPTSRVLVEYALKRGQSYFESILTCFGSNGN